MTTATAEYTTPSDVEFQITKLLDAPRELVWDAFTKPEHLTQWMLGPEGWSMPRCDIDLRPGGQWHYQWQHEGGETMDMNGVYKEISPFDRLVSSENWGGPYPETVNTVTFTEVEGGKTLVTTTVRYASTAAREAALATGMTKGVELSYVRLERILKALQAQS